MITQKPNLHQLLLKMLPEPSWKKAGLLETHKDISESQTINTDSSVWEAITVL